MEQEEALLCYGQAADCLPVRLRRLAAAVPEEQKRLAEEFRLRAGLPMTLLIGDRELAPWDERVEPEDLELVVNLVTDFSRYAASDCLRNGYLPARGGCRIGLCGTAVMRDGAVTNLRELSSVVVRIAHEKRGIGVPLLPQLFADGIFQSTLLISPPGGGKTTLLRDLVRCLSDGGVQPPQRVALLDERGEVAVAYQGLPQMDVGRHTDVLDACPKALGIPMVLRALNPQIIAVDEITERADIAAMTHAANCGVGLLATVHGGSVGELLQKPLYQDLLDAKVFRLAIVLEKREGARHYSVEELPC
ncbi:MAG: stage III sporulation protein AA [Oscillospiraceae bacterium]